MANTDNAYKAALAQRVRLVDYVNGLKSQKAELQASIDNTMITILAVDAMIEALEPHLTPVKEEELDQTVKDALDGVVDAAA